MGGTRLDCSIVRRRSFAQQIWKYVRCSNYTNICNSLRYLERRVLRNFLCGDEGGQIRYYQSSAIASISAHSLGGETKYEIVPASPLCLPSLFSIFSYSLCTNHDEGSFDLFPAPSLSAISVPPSLELRTPYTPASRPRPPSTTWPI